MTSWLRRMSAVVSSRDADRELIDELNGHLDAHIEDNLRAGMAPDAARRDALIRLGGIAQAAEAYRARQRLPFLETTMQDLRYALRMLRKSPGFAAAAIVTLALGIGANTAIFSVLNAVILRPLAYQRPAQLMKLASTFPAYDEFWISVPEFLEFREWTRAFSSVGAYTSTETNLSAPDRPRRVRATAISDDMLTTLRVPARLGRTFAPDDSRPGAAPVVLLSDDLWRSALGGDPAVVGRSVEIDGVRRTIVGIMPDGFDVADERAELWLPLVIDPATANRGGHFLYVIGRLADGQTPMTARAELDTLLARWQRDARGTRNPNGLLHAPDPKLHRWRIDPLQASIVGTARTAVWVLQGAVLLVLLIACANLSTLLLSRAESRRREFAVRSALGATSTRLLRQSVAEGCLLSAIGGTLGLGIAVAGIRALVAAFPDSLPRSGTISLDWRVLTFTLVVGLATGIVFGLAPLFHLSVKSTAPALKEGGHRTTGAHHLLRRGLVVAEIALAVALVAGAGLLLRTVGNLARVDAGFDRTHLITFAVDLPDAKYTRREDRRAFFQRLTGELSSVPGVLGVGAMTGLPPLRQVNANTTLIEGYTPQPGGPSTDIEYYQQISAAYLDTMGIPVVEGRPFDASDADGPPTVLVNETMAKAFWPGQSALGHRVRPCCSPAIPWLSIVGVVRDVKQGGVDRKTGTELYINAERNAPSTMNVVIRTPLPVATLAGTIHRTVAALDPALPVVGLSEMDEVFEKAIGRPRLLAQLLTIFAILALALSSIGTYGVLSYMVAERRREIGVRMALGATRRSVMQLIVGQGLLLAVTGIAIGLALVFAAGRLITSLLFGVSAGDPAVIAGVIALIAGIALAACSLPGLSATRVDPMVALREE